LPIARFMVAWNDFACQALHYDLFVAGLHDTTTIFYLGVGPVSGTGQNQACLQQECQA